MNDAPIFIHSLFRAGSTYLFNVFRRSECGYWCYQEALHEFVYFNRNEPSVLLSIGANESTHWRHPQLINPYWHELHDVWPAWKDALNEKIIYDVYFADQTEEIGVAYWQALAEAARGRPVFQECRTAGRIGAIKSQMKGAHIYLWRNPWDQWWSYKITPYFDVANQIIIHVRHAPQPVRCLLATLGLPAYGRDDLAGAFAFYSARPLGSEHSYLVFYLLWCLALREGIGHADLMLNIDRLSDSADYQSEMKARFKDAGIDGIDFSDCRVPQGRYLEKDQIFFCALERQVYLWLIEGGWTEQEINQIKVLRQQNQPVSWLAPIENSSPADMAEQASRARMLACRYETSSASAEAKAQQTEAKAQQAEVKAHQAELKAQQAEVRAKQAEAVYNSVINSRSWRITEPLRLIFNGLSRLRNGGKHALKSVLKQIIGRAIRFVSDRPHLKRLALAWVRKHPRLEQRLRRFASVVGGVHSGKEPNPPMKLANLTPHARRIYADLKTAIERRQKENG
jgi:hypothetical protein